MEPLTGGTETAWPADIPRTGATFTLSFIAVVTATVAAFVSLCSRAADAATDSADTVGWDAVPGLRAGCQVMCLLVPLLVATFVIAWSGVLQHWDSLPPPFMLLMLPLYITTVLLATKARGTNQLGHPGVAASLSSLPMGQLVGFQSFRIFVELVLHLGYSQG